MDDAKRNITNSENCPLRLGIKSSRNSSSATFLHGSIVLKGGAIISRASNRGLKHAEVNAISKIHPDKRNGLTVWSIRTSRAGTKVAEAKPCADCHDFMKANGVKKVYYSTTAGEIEVMKL